MEISTEKTKLMTNNTSGINKEIKVNGQKFETVTSIKHLDSVVSDEGSEPEILFSIAQTTAALTRLKPVLDDRGIFSQLQDTTDALPCRIHLLCACKSWTLTAEFQRRIQAMEMRCYGKIRRVSYKDHVTTRKSVPRSSRHLDHMKIS